MEDPYYLRKANIDQLDLSKFEKDYTIEELSQVKDALKLAQQQHQEGFDKLPITQRAKYHAADVMEYVEQNPETFLAVPTAVALLGAGKAVTQKGAESVHKVRGTLRDYMASKSGDEGLLASQQAEKAAAQTGNVQTPVSTQPTSSSADFSKLIQEYESKGLSYSDAIDAATKDLYPNVAALNQTAPTTKEISAQATPKTDVDVTANVGKPFSPTDVSLVERSEATTAKKTAEKNVATAEKTMAQAVAGGLPPPTLTTGTGKPAYEGQSDATKIKSSYASPADIPKGYAWVPNAQYVDVHRQDLGQQLYTEQFKNRPFSETYMGSPTAAVEVNREINRAAGRMTREEALAKGIPAEKIGEPTKGIFERIGGNPKASKAVKVAGIVGAVTAIPNLANAKEIAGSVGEAIIPLGATPLPLESGRLPEVERKERSDQFILNQPGNRLELEFLQKGKSPAEANKIRDQYLASAPMTDYERALRVFRQQAYSKKGIAPPSMR